MSMMNETLDDLAKIIEVVRSKAEVSAFEGHLSEISSILADMYACMERPPPVAAAVEPPKVTVNVSPTPVSVNVSPTPVTVQAGAVNVQAPASWTEMEVEMVRKHGNITSMKITRKS